MTTPETAANRSLRSRERANIRRSAAAIKESR